MAKKREPESETLERAHAELQAIAGDLEAIKPRLVAMARRLVKAAKTAAVVETHPDGHTYTVEQWMADLLRETVRESIDNLLQGLAHAADADGLRAEIRAGVERDRRIAAKHASAN